AFKQNKRWHGILNSLFSSRGCLFNGCPNILQFLLDILWITCYIFINVIGFSDIHIRNYLKCIAIIKLLFFRAFFLAFFSGMQGLLQQVFYLAVGAPEFFSTPAFYILQYFRVYT